MRKIGNQLFYVIKLDNWKRIEKAYNLPEDYLLKKKFICKRFLNEDSEALFSTSKQIDDLSKALQLTLYDLLCEFDLKLEEDVVPRALVDDYTSEEINIKAHISRSRLFREQFLQARERLGMSVTDNIDTPDLSTDEKIRDYLELDTEEYKNLKTEGASKNSKLIHLKKKIENIGCLVFETGKVKPINNQAILGLFSWYEQWPIIILNSKVKSATRKIFTLIHELFHFLQSKNNRINIVSGEAAEYEANKFAARILFPRNKYIGKGLEEKDVTYLKNWVIKNTASIGVSQLSQMFTLLNNNIISQESFEKWKVEYDERPEKRTQGGTYYAPTECSKIIGVKFIKLLYDTYMTGIYSMANVSGKLGVKQSYVEEVFEYWL